VSSRTVISSARSHALAAPWESLRPTKVVGIEARGFILGAAVAHALGAGFVAVRKEGGLFPGSKVERIALPDYRGLEHRLRVRRDGLSDSDRVVLIDDWCEEGSQALAAKQMVEECGSVVLGLAVIVDESGPGFAASFSRFEGFIRGQDRKTAAREMAMLLPNLAMLFKGLIKDPRVPRGSKALLLFGAAWIASPIDLIPEFIPFLGPLDDAVVAALILRRLVRTAGREVVEEHWRGDPAVIARLLRVVESRTGHNKGG